MRALALLLAAALAPLACSERADDAAGPALPPLEPPAAPVPEEGEGIELPPPPPLMLPPTPPGETSVLELRVRGEELRGEELRVRGVVVGADDCDPPPAERPRCAPHFIVADEAGAAAEAGVLIAGLPDDATVPRVGDAVLVRGTWSDVAPGGLRDTRGLLIYRELEAAP